MRVHYLVLQKIEKDFAGLSELLELEFLECNFTPPNAFKVDELVTELVRLGKFTRYKYYYKSGNFSPQICLDSSDF